ncbi:NAD(P)-binding domain-containing protein [Natronoarchaeum sp. GCM10025703]
MTEIRVIGMGFVGIPLAVAFDDAGHEVVGLDIKEERIRELRLGTTRLTN